MDDSKLSAGEFKATCLKLMDEVAATGRSVTITKRGRPVARLVPIELPMPRGPVFGALSHMISIVGDIDGASSYSFEQQAAETIREWDELEAGAKPRRQHRAPKPASRSKRS